MSKNMNSDHIRSDRVENQHERIDRRDEYRRIHNPPTSGQRYFESIIDSVRTPENNYGKAYSQDFLRRYLG